MQLAVNNDLKSFGTKTIYIDKWQYSGGPDFPWWKDVKRPVPKFEEARLLRLKVPDAEHIDFAIDNMGNVDYGDNSLTGVQYYGNTEDFDKIEQVAIGSGRYFQQADFDRGNTLYRHGLPDRGTAIQLLRKKLSGRRSNSRMAK